MAVGAVSASVPQVRPQQSGYEAPSHLYDDIKSVAQPAGAWLYQNVWKPSKGVVPSGNFWKELGVGTLKSNFMSSLTYDGIGSVIRNGLALIQHKEKPARAAGNIVADIGVGTAKGVISGLAVTGATMGLTAIGMVAAPALLGWPIMVGAMGVSWLAYKFLNKADQKYGIHQKISDSVTHLMDKNA